MLEQDEHTIEFPESGIYAIINIVNNKIYVGSASNLKIRWRIHRNELNRNDHDNKVLQHSWNKYSQVNFLFTVLEYCEKEKLVEREQYWLDSFQCFAPDNGYNICKIAESRFGMKHTEEAKIKMRVPRSLEARKNMSLAQTGLKRSEEHIKKSIEGKKGYKHSEETKAKIGMANRTSLLGKKHSKETKRKMSEAKWKNFKISEVILWKP